MTSLWLNIRAAAVTTLMLSLAARAQEYSCDLLADPLVFDPLFYLNDNPDLQQAGYDTAEASRGHWCDTGAYEGRQGASTFHSRQYLDRYEDLAAAFGADYAAAIEHYVIIGFYDEHRIGYLEGGAYGRWTVRSTSQPGGTYLYASASERTAGAIDSVVWGNKEFINNYDHGRQLQLAVTLPPYGECWNPTEAGGRADGNGDETRSVVQHVVASQNVITTTNHPAYWFRTGSTATQPSGDGCEVGDTALNDRDTHPFNMSKTVSLGCFGMDNCMEWMFSADLGSDYGQPTDYHYAQIEGPTAYCMADFTAAKRWNYDTDELLDEPEEGGEDIWPVIIMTPDAAHAIGSYAHPSDDFYIEMRYAYYDFGIVSYDAATFKWSVVFRETKNPGDTVEHMSWVCVGTLDMVHDCLRTVRHSLLAETN